MLIKMIPGIKFIEMTLNRLRVTCCDGGLLSIHSIELSIEIACEKRIREIKPLKTNFVVTACPTCYKTLQYGAIKAGAEPKVLEIPQLLLSSIK
ncbi:MAG: (Fe-S)-binding protein, partial [Thermoprotei archaeon]